MTVAYTHSNCSECGEHGYVGPLHGERGGPLLCLLCRGKWDAEHTPRLRARRILIRAMKAYDAAGGSLYGTDFDGMKLLATADCLDHGNDFKDLTTELLTAVIALTHPDGHAPERNAEAQRVTQELTALKPFVFPAPEPEPEPPPKKREPESGDASSEGLHDIFGKMLAYPCEDCRDTVPMYYCTACKARWGSDQVKEREREETKRKRKNARQRSHYKWQKQLKAHRVKPTACATCGEAFKPKRTDAKFCSAACRQRAYMQRDGKRSNSKPLGREEIERIITEAFTSNPDSAFTTDELCDRVYLGLKRPERKHRAAVTPIAKKVCEQLGEHWEWWRSEKRGGTLVFLNHASVTSYAMARLKSWRYRSATTDEELKAEIAPGGRHHEYVVEGGAWWGHCQEAIAKFKQTMTAKQNDASDDFNKLSRRGSAVTANLPVPNLARDP